LQLCDDAADHDYVNDSLQTPLVEAYSSIFNIITRQIPHPIMQLFSTHIAQERLKFNVAFPNSDSENDKVKQGLTDPFNDTIIDKCFGLLHDIALEAGHKIHCERCIPRYDWDWEWEFWCEMEQHVRVWTYLGPPAENDVDIFEAVKDSQISHIWTSHEQALAGCYGEENTSPEAVFGTKPMPNLWKVKITKDTTLELAEDCPFVAISQLITWMSRSGLTGRLCKPWQYRPPYLRMLELGPWPKPKPAYCKIVLNTIDEPSDPIVSRKKGPSAMMEDIETPTTNKISKLAKDSLVFEVLSNHLMGDAEDFVQLGVPEKLRQGSRQVCPTLSNHTLFRILLDCLKFSVDQYLIIYLVVCTFNCYVISILSDFSLSM
jgi:hypothetical protein